MWKSLKNRKDPTSAPWMAASPVLLVLIGMAAIIGLRHNPEHPDLQGNPIDWNGHRWSEFSAAEKETYLGGFLAGAAAAQALTTLEGDDMRIDAEALSQRVERLRAERALIFPYAPNLYHARLHDYLFYANNREQPLYRALAELNFQLRARP